MPAYFAAKTLEQTVKEIPAGWVDEIIVVDDASADGTAEVARNLGLKTIVHTKNTGYGGNQKTCYQAALKAGADIVVMLHPDYQYDPKAVPALVDPLLKEEADAVFGSRLKIPGQARQGGMPFWKFWANKFLTALENLVLGFGLSEYQTGLRAWSRRVLESVPFEQNSDDFAFDIEIVVQLKRYNFLRIKEVPIPTSYFPGASTMGFKSSLIYGFKTLGVLIRAILKK